MFRKNFSKEQKGLRLNIEAISQSGFLRDQFGKWDVSSPLCQNVISFKCLMECTSTNPEFSSNT